MSLPSLLNISGTSHRPSPTAFDRPLRGASRAGWTVDLARYGTTITHLRISSPEGAPVIITSDSPRIPTVEGALMRMPVPNLHALFEFDHPARDVAWDAARRLFGIGLNCAPYIDSDLIRRTLSWAVLTYPQELAWKAVGVTSGVTAEYFIRNGLTPAQIAPYSSVKNQPTSGWHRVDLALYARHRLSETSAREWAAIGLSNQTVALLLDGGYTTADTHVLRRLVGTASTGHRLHDWAKAHVPAPVAIAAVQAGLSPTEATALTTEDIDALTMMAALRH